MKYSLFIVALLCLSFVACSESKKDDIKAPDPGEVYKPESRELVKFLWPAKADLLSGNLGNQPIVPAKIDEAYYKDKTEVENLDQLEAALDRKYKAREIRLKTSVVVNRKLIVTDEVLISSADPSAMLIFEGSGALILASSELADKVITGELCDASTKAKYVVSLRITAKVKEARVRAMHSAHLALAGGSEGSVKVNFSGVSGLIAFGGAGSYILDKDSAFDAKVVRIAVVGVDENSKIEFNYEGVISESIIFANAITKLNLAAETEAKLCADEATLKTTSIASKMASAEAAEKAASACRTGKWTQMKTNWGECSAIPVKPAQ